MRGVWLTFAVATASLVVVIVLLRISSSFSDPSRETSALLGHEDARALEARDARRGFARIEGACGVSFDEGEAHLEARAIALAVVDGYDPEAQRVSLRPSASGQHVATDCRGRLIELVHARDSPDTVTVLTSLVSGAPDALERVGLSSSVVARVILGEDGDGCPAGLIAIVTLRGRRLDVDALAAWRGGCGAVDPLDLRAIDGGFALVESVLDPRPTRRSTRDDDEREDDEPNPLERAWLMRGRDLVLQPERAER